MDIKDFLTSMRARWGTEADLNEFGLSVGGHRTQSQTRDYRPQACSGANYPFVGCWGRWRGHLAVTPPHSPHQLVLPVQSSPSLGFGATHCQGPPSVITAHGRDESSLCLPTKLPGDLRGCHPLLSTRGTVVLKWPTAGLRDMSQAFVS